MTIEIRPLAPGDAQACDEIIASLPYRFGQEEGRPRWDRAGADGSLDERDDGYASTRAFYAANGFELPRDFGGYWSGGDTPVLMVRVLG
jgi:hypothetical protein